MSILNKAKIVMLKNTCFYLDLIIIYARKVFIK